MVNARDDTKGDDRVPLCSEVVDMAFPPERWVVINASTNSLQVISPNQSWFAISRILSQSGSGTTMLRRAFRSCMNCSIVV